MHILKRAASFAEKLRGTTQAPPYPHVELYFWRPDDGSLNFGDFLSEVVVRKVLADRGRALEEETSKAARLVGIGSILHLARDGDVIWGSGINGRPGQDRPYAARLDVRAVRGPLTRAILLREGIAVPEIYGDPAFLLPKLFQGRFDLAKTRDHIFIPNLHDLPAMQGRADIVSPLLSWNRCVQAIVSARLVVSSSLHGLVIAEAFGVPARYVRLSESEGSLKYEDYYEGTGRSGVRHAKQIEEALDLGGVTPPVFSGEELLSAFPMDLWDL